MRSEPAPVRVLYVETSRGGVVGGSLTGLQHLLQGLDRGRYAPTVVLYEDKPQWLAPARLGIPVRVFHKERRGRRHPLQQVGPYRRLRGRPRVAQLLRAVWELRVFVQETLPSAFALRRLFAEERPDLVHLCIGFHANLDAIIAAWWLGIPCVCHVKWFAQYGWLDRLFARTVDVGICMTEALRASCEDHGVRAKRMTVIYDGLDLGAFRPSRDGAAVRHELGIPPGVPLVGIVGHIQAWKGQDVVLRALRRVRDTVPAVHCLVVGGVHRRGSEYARDLHRFVEEHGLESHVIFTGPRDDVPDLMTAMDVVIHASVVPEPFGRVILEGMAAARPVIATDMGGVPEILTDGVTGKLVPPDDPQSLAVAIVALLADADQRRRLGDNARAEVERRFTMQRHVRDVTDVYASLGRTARREP